MKQIIIGLMLLNSLSVFSKEKQQYTDISINELINYHCAKSGYFNNNACLVYVNKCYREYPWPTKTVYFHLKLNVFHDCVSTIYN